MGFMNRLEWPDPQVISWLVLVSYGWLCYAGVPACDKPVLLLMLSDGGLLAYQAFQPPHQPLAFRRLPLDWIPHMTPPQTPPSPLPHPNAVQPSSRMQVSVCFHGVMPLLFIIECVNSSTAQ